MAVLYEHYEEISAHYASIYANLWHAQSFTPLVSHVITKVSIYCHKYLSEAQNIGNLTIGIYFTDENGYPTENALCSGHIDGSSIEDGLDSKWVEILLDTEYTLETSIQYAFVLDARNGNSQNKIVWDINNSGSYANGVFTSSDDSGENWATMYEDEGDGSFREYGNPINDVVPVLPAIVPSLQALWGW